MQVKFLSYLRDITESAEIDIPASANVGDLLHLLVDRYGQKFKDKILSPGGELGPEIIILINGRQVTNPGGMETPLKDDDIVQILPMAAGG